MKSIFEHIDAYPPNVLALQDPEGFRDAVLSCSKHFKHQHEAFDYINEEHVRLFGKPKYIDYDSYSASVSRRHNSSYYNRNDIAT